MSHINYIIKKYRMLIILLFLCLFVGVFFIPIFHSGIEDRTNVSIYSLVQLLSKYEDLKLSYIEMGLSITLGIFYFPVLILPILVTVLYFLILCCYILFIIKKKNYLVFTVLFGICFLVISTYIALFAYGYRGSPVTVVPTYAFYIVLACTVLLCLLFLLDRYFTKHNIPLREIIHKRVKPHKPTKAERIVELERQIQELKNQVNKDGQ